MYGKRLNLQTLSTFTFGIIQSSGNVGVLLNFRVLQYPSSLLLRCSRGDCRNYSNNAFVVVYYCRPNADDTVSDEAEAEELDVPAKSTRKRKQSASSGESKRHGETGLLSRTEIRNRIADGTCELRPHAKKSRSEIWSFFSDVYNNETQELLPYCACNRCHKVYKHGPNGGTSCLAEHVQTCIANSEEQGVLAEFLETPVQRKSQALLDLRQEK